MSSMTESLADRIFGAALLLFGRHGFQRTSMADIAKAAGIARATLYLRFADKRALFEGLAASLVDQALADAAAAADREKAELASTVQAIVMAKELRFFKIINGAPHGAELLAVDTELTARHVARLDKEYIDILTRFGRYAEERGADLSAFGGPAGFANFLATAGAGLKHEVRDEAAYREAVQRLARVTARAARR